MAEPGGPTAQAGIYYQNTVAALYLGALLDFKKYSDRNTRVISVRIEAPESVDDTVVTYANGSKLYIQAKENLSLSGEPWRKFWLAAAQQVRQSNNHEDQIRLVLGTLGINPETLRETLERATGKLDLDEWLKSLNDKQKTIADSIQIALAVSPEDAFSIIKRVRVDFITMSSVETSLIKDWMPTSNETPLSLLTRLRDCCGAGGRVRQQFCASDLSELLLTKYKVRILGSHGDEIQRYRQTLATQVNQISVPGTPISVQETQLLVWPRVCLVDRGDYSDFEIEDLRSRDQRTASEIDLRKFPTAEKLLILESGAGQGKSTLIRATARRLAMDTSFVPVVVHAEAIPEHETFLGFLNSSYNLKYNLTIDWERLLEQGRAVVFIDGVDEISDDRRAKVLEMVGLLNASFNDVPILIGARDAAVASLSPKFSVCRVQRLDHTQMIAMLTAYIQVRGQLNLESILRHIDRSTELSLLCKVPLFLSIFVATIPKKGEIPRGRVELLERYIIQALSPDRYKGVRTKSITKTQLRRGAEAVAMMALDRNESAISEPIVRISLCKTLGDTVGDECIETLLQNGLLEARGSRIAFSIPTVQEYLAGCALAESDRLSTDEWLLNFYRRPWAQAFQFAIARVENAEAILMRQMTQPDDLFYTYLRLAARCIVNGAHVSSDLRSILSRRLARAWVKGGYSVSQKIGHLIEDGFCDPVLPPDIREALVTSENLWLSRGIILARAQDHALTLECLKFVLSTNDIRELWSAEWATALKPIIPSALALILHRSRNATFGTYIAGVVASIVYGFREEKCIDWVPIYDDQTLPAEVRLAAKLSADRFDFNHDREMLNRAFTESDSHSPWNGFNEVYISRNGWKEHFRNLFNAPTVEGELNPLELMGGPSDDFAAEVDFIAEIARDPLTHASFVQPLSLWLGAHGLQEFALASTNSLAMATADQARSWCFSAGMFPKDVVRTGVEVLLARDFSIRDRIAVLEALYELAMNEPVNAPGRRYAHRRLERPSEIANLVAAEAKISIATANISEAHRRALFLLLAEHGDIEALNLLGEEMGVYLESHEVISGDDWNSWFARAIGIGARIKLDLKLDLLWRIVEKSGNLPMYEVVTQIATKLGDQAYEEFARYANNNPKRNMWSAIYHFLEENAERNGLKVERIDNELVITKV